MKQIFTEINPHLPAHKEACWTPYLYQIDQPILLYTERPHQSWHLPQTQKHYKENQKTQELKHA